MAEIVVILGSGFSKPAGLPLTKDINDYFLRDNANKILKFGSGEFKWEDFADDTYKHNGRIGYDCLSYGILLNEFVNLYVDDNKEFTNYEDFYQFVIDNLNDEKIIDDLKNKSISSFKEHFPHINENPYYKNYTNAIENFQYREFRSMINHLIGDLLYVRKTKDVIKEQYKCIIEHLIKYITIDFITLNHDLLLESLLTDLVKKQYSDGFTKDQKILKSSDGESLMLFQGAFSDSVNIIKLHGSIDTYRYAIADENGSIVNPTGEFLYFQTSDYDEKQKPIRHDPESGEIIQRFHWEIDPQFITGTRKKDIINKPGIYKTLYEEFENRIMNNASILIIGYSFSDEHVNETIKTAINKSKKLTKIININPSKTLPFKSKKTVVYNIKDVSELESITKLTYIDKIREYLLIHWYKIWRKFIFLGS